MILRQKQTGEWIWYDLVDSTWLVLMLLLSVLCTAEDDQRSGP